MREVYSLLAQSEGVPWGQWIADSPLDDSLRQALTCGVAPVSVHRDGAAQRALELMGASACCVGEKIYLGSEVGSSGGPSLAEVLRHELVHVAQVRRARRGGAISTREEVEGEAVRIAEGTQSAVLHGADSNEIYTFWWLIPLAAAAYVLLRPNVANAPEPGGKTYPSVSELQVGGEAMALFAVPEGVFGATSGLKIGRLALGFWGRSALAGAASMTSFQGVQDAGSHHFSGVDVYVYDAATGAIIGVVVPGAIKLIGSGIRVPLDGLATHFMRESDFALTNVIAERAAAGPVAADELASIFASRGRNGQIAEWWLNRRGMIVVYRGQAAPTTSILSPMARENGLAASEALVTRMRAGGLSAEEMAGYTGRWHTDPVPPMLAPPGLGNLPLGAAGIPTTRIPGLASDFGPGGVVYIIRMPRASIFKVDPWSGLAVENEWVVLNQIPRDAIIDMVPATRIPPLRASDAGGSLVLGSRAGAQAPAAFDPEVLRAMKLLNSETSRLPRFGVPPHAKKTLDPPGAGKVTESTFCMRPNSDYIHPVCTTTKTYMVKRGDSLWGLAQKFYGDPKQVTRIYQANQPVLGPNVNAPRMLPGQTLVIP